MSDAHSARKMSIAERIASLQKRGSADAPPLLTKANQNALPSRIAALQKNADSTAGSSEGPKTNPPIVGKLKPPTGAVPIMTFGSGPPLSLLNKQKEREERMAKLQQEANLAGADPEEKPTVGKLKPPAGGVPIVPFGTGPPPSLLEKTKKREEQMAKLQQKATAEQAHEDVDDALLSRPTIKGSKRRPRTRV